MLIGRYDAKVGAKNRIALPKKFREILGDKLIITQGYENSLIIVSQKNWEELLEGTYDKPFIQSEARETRRFLLGGASSIELDDKGRFIIPSYLREFGKIEEEIIFLGLYKHVELWDKKRWEEYSKNLEKNIDKISQKLVEHVDKRLNNE
ncbi:MAG: division/cell wall cluster transcriptional repressor MraZ [Patescibacteria group bacterium]|nr:division/cell wall cluster transcriptional repressor MraZ [Patescibacteria group bacterium]